MPHGVKVVDNRHGNAEAPCVAEKLCLVPQTLAYQSRINRRVPVAFREAMLYDNVKAPNGGIELRNRGSMGSGHGWSMGWGVAWNCTAESYIIQSAPGAPNWMIGCIGDSRLSPRPFGQGPNLPEGIKDSHGAPVAPQSLYLAQLAERLGPQAVRNIGY